MSDGWDLIYKYTLIKDLAGSWIGIMKIMHAALTVHALVWAIVVIVGVQLLTDALEYEGQKWRSGRGGA